VPSPSSGSGDKLENGSDPYSDEFDEIYPEFLLIYNYAIFFSIEIILKKLYFVSNPKCDNP
jgi:hypothetical protein